MQSIDILNVVYGYSLSENVICIYLYISQCTDACFHSHLCKPLYQTNISDILSIHIAHSINVQCLLGTIRNDDIHVTYMQ